MASLVEFYNIKNWYKTAFTAKEKKYIKQVIPFLSCEDYSKTEQPLCLALTDCFIDVSSLSEKIWETKLHIPVNGKIFDKALDVFYHSETTPIQKHFFYNAIIEQRSYIDSFYEDPLIERLCDEQIANSEAAKKMFLAKKVKLGKHEGYSNLIRIYKYKDINKCKRLCNDALSQGWRGQWRRMHNSMQEKEKQEELIATGTFGSQIFTKRLPLENADFNQKYWDKNNRVFFPVRKALKNNRKVYYYTLKNDTIITKETVKSISFKRGDIFLLLANGETIKIPMNMVLEKSYVDREGKQFASFFTGCDDWRVSEDSIVPDCDYMISSFEDDKNNPLINKDLILNDKQNLENESILSFSNPTDKWNEFFLIVKSKNEENEVITVTIFHDDDSDRSMDEKLLLLGDLKEIKVNKGKLRMKIDGTVIDVEDSIEDIDISFPEEGTPLFGVFSCSINMKEYRSISVVIGFGSFTKRKIIDGKKR